MLNFDRETLDITQPIELKVPRVGLNECNDKGKPCRTIFSLVHFDKDSNTSIVRCMPQTGRTHQIRVHLNWLGFPITNDPLYGKGSKVEKISEASVETVEKNNVDLDCPDCTKKIIYKEPDEEQLTLYLHAFSYSGEKWKYQTDWPEWAKITSNKTE